MDAAQHTTPGSLEDAVRQYAGLVYRAALRQLGDPHLAEDVTQAVFLILQQKWSRLGPGTILPAWLLKTTRFACMDATKRQRRRAYHERRAAMQEPVNEANHDDLMPLIDEGLARLAERDRAAVVLAYLEKKSHAQVAQLLGITEGTAHKRIQRAIIKLRKFFARRGAKVSALAIGTALAAALDVHTAPANVIPATLAALSGHAPATAAAIAKGTTTMLKMLKIKAAAAVFAAATVVGITIFPHSHAAAQPASAPAAVPAAGAADPDDPFEPEVTLTLDETHGGSHYLADLDFGKTLARPADADKGPLAEFDWMDEHGVDLWLNHFNSGTNLIAVGAAIVPTDGDHYAHAAPIYLMQGLLPCKTGTVIPLAIDTLPAVFAFRTRDGAVGLMQLSDHQLNPESLVVHYKLLKAPARNAAAAQAARQFLPFIAREEDAFRNAAAAQDPPAMRIAAGRIARAAAALVELSNATPLAEASRRENEAARRLAESADRNDDKGMSRGIDDLATFRENVAAEAARLAPAK